MRISKIEIQNFRGFKKEVIELDDITVFVGENNTGKSTVLDAIRLVIGTQDWNEKLTKYDYHLISGSSKAGEAGEILLRIEVSEKQEDEWPDEIQQTLPDSIDIDDNGLRHFYLALKGQYNLKDEKSTESKEFQTKTYSPKGSKANTGKCFSDFKNLVPVFYITSLRDSNKEFQQKKGLFKKFLDSEVITSDKRLQLETKLGTLNTEIIDVLENIKQLKGHLKKSMTVLSGTDE
jgi:putative ATP-dependent endonuclease of OLD family